MNTRRRFLALSATATLSVLAGCQVPTGGDDDISVPYSVTTPVSSDDGDPGWILLERHEGAYTATFDLRICGDVADVEATEIDEETYRLEVTADLTDADSCRPARLLGSFDAPTEELTLSLHVSVNGEHLETIDRRGTTTSLHDLPDRITADGAGR